MAGTIISFYSFKGGVGRSFALANVAAILARWGYRVLCVDFDLEAPGLDGYFRDYLPADHGGRGGMVELIADLAANAIADWTSYADTVALPGADASLSLISAGREDDTYVRRMQALDWPALYSRHDLGNRIEELRDAWREAYDFVLVDSRTGVSDIGGICTIQMPDVLCALFTANQQSLEGCLDVMARAAAQRHALPFERAAVPCVPVPSRFDGRVQYELAAEWLERFAVRLAPLYEPWLHRALQPRRILDLIRIPYVAYWSFGEKLAVIDQGTRDPESIGFAFETLAALLAHRLADTDLLARDRDAFVDAVCGSANASAAHDSTVMVLLDAADESLGAGLRAALAPSGFNVIIHRVGARWANQDDDAFAEKVRSARNFVFVIGATHGAITRFRDFEFDRAVRRILLNRHSPPRLATILGEGVGPEDVPPSLRFFVSIPADGNPAQLWVDQLVQLLRSGRGDQ